MGIDSIRSEQEYQTALKVAESLMSALPGTPEGERLDWLVSQLVEYEQRQNFLGLPHSRAVPSVRKR